MKPNFPKHWGNQPVIQTRDYKPLPEPYQDFHGSTSLIIWILGNQKKDNENDKEVVNTIEEVLNKLQTESFSELNYFKLKQLNEGL